MAVCDQPGYSYRAPVEFDYGGNDVQIEVSAKQFVETPGMIQFRIHVKHVNFRGNSPLRVVAKVTWLPSDASIEEVNAKNQQKINEFNAKTKHEYEKALVEAARDRIKKASMIEPRTFEDQREEERIVVYRSLIQQMLTKDIPMPDDRTRHVVAELLNTIFDVDKMLYFVAAEYWRPRLHHSHQMLGGIRTPSDVGEESPAAGSGLTNTVYSEVVTAAGKDVINSLISGEDTQIAATDTVTLGRRARESDG